MRTVLKFFGCILMSLLFVACGDNVSLVKNGYLEFDRSVTLGNALDKYKYFIKTEWKSFTTEKDQNVVEFIGFADINKIKEHIIFNTNGLKERISTGYVELEYLTDQIITIQFSINNNKTFNIRYVGLSYKDSEGIKKEEKNINLDGFFQVIYQDNLLSSLGNAYSVHTTKHIETGSIIRDALYLFAQDHSNKSYPKTIMDYGTLVKIVNSIMNRNNRDAKLKPTELEQGVTFRDYKSNGESYSLSLYVNKGAHKGKCIVLSAIDIKYTNGIIKVDVCPASQAEQESAKPKTATAVQQKLEGLHEPQAQQEAAEQHVAALRPHVGSSNSEAGSAGSDTGNTQISAASVGLPKTKMGDTYIIEYLNPDNPKSSYSTERKVVSVGEGQIIVAAKNIKSKTSKVRTLHFTPEWNLVSSRNPDGSGFDYSPPLKYFEFPLYPGKTWQQRSRETSMPTGAVREHTLSATVGDWEDIAVPAGTFHALKITLQTELLDRSTGEKSTGTDISWYAPDMRRSVRSETFSRNVQEKQERQVIQVIQHDLK